MKLRNLMYATMIACSFASCSNYDLPTPDQGGANAEGTVLSVKFDAPLATKADGSIDEKIIISICMYLVMEYWKL